MAVDTSHSLSLLPGLQSMVFPKLIFLKAELGHNPSYVWRSLLAARDIIRAGSQWKVGDGKKIRGAVDNWLTHKPIFTGEDQTNMLVGELIDDDTAQWNR